MKVYVVLGTKENVYQDEIGGHFVPHPDKEVVKVFSSQESAENFIRNNKLNRPKKERYGDASYYKGGYCEMEIECAELE
jgi:hypothetical protein